MARIKSYFRKPTQTIAIQAATLKSAFPESKITFERDRGMVWVGKIHPTPLSAIYTLRIKYRLGERPEVTVLDPLLVPRKGERLPHVFEGNLLCLFRYKYYEWDSSMLIDKTIVSWASLWLFHYEVWYATGVWCGSKEEHPSDETSKKSVG